jgi:hypothetical protein
VNEKLAKIGRLALRVENERWVAYYALEGTMKGAVWLGAIKLSAVSEGIKGGKERGLAFRTLMQELVADILEEQLGVRPSWPDQPKPAPEHERGAAGATEGITRHAGITGLDEH